MKLKRNLTTILIIIVASALIVYVSFSIEGSMKSNAWSSFLGRNREVTIIINCSLSGLPREVPLLRVVRRNITETEALYIAREVFNLTDDVFGEVKVIRLRHVLTVFKNKIRLIFFDCGAIRYTTPEYYSTYPPPILPSEEEAIRKAESFMRKIRNYGLMPRNPKISIKLHRVGPTAWSSISALDIEWPTELSVRYWAYYEDKILFGPSDEIEVVFGDNGKIIAFYGYWREVEEAGKIELTVSIEEAIEKLKESSMLLKSSKVATIVINNVRLAYWVGDVLKGPEYLPPIYLFDALVVFTDGTKGLINLWVPATKELQLYPP